MAATATSNAITLKGSTEIVAEFFRKVFYFCKNINMCSFFVPLVLDWAENKTESREILCNLQPVYFHNFDNGMYNMSYGATGRASAANIYM